jgi:hypothetical protein
MKRKSPEIKKERWQVQCRSAAASREAACSILQYFTKEEKWNTMKKKLMSLALALVMCLTLCIPAFANESLDVGEEVIYASTTSNGDPYRVTSTKSNGTCTIRSYENNVLTEKCVVVPGSAEYTKITYDNSKVTSSQRVVLDNVTTTLPALSASADGYMGTMYYDNIQYIYMIRCYINNSVDPTSNWKVQSYVGKVGDFIVDLVAALGITSYIAEGLVQGLVAAGLFSLLKGVIDQITTVTLSASVTSHTITGKSTDPIDSTYHSSELYGKTAVITDLTHHYAGHTFTEGYTPAGWGTGEFGRAMFKALYHSDWTPTGWTD